jgi:hypothetical protein
MRKTLIALFSPSPPPPLSRKTPRRRHADADRPARPTRPHGGRADRARGDDQPGGGGLTVVYDMEPGQPESKRVLRLENVNGMLEVIYDEAMPSTMALGSGGTPRLVQGGGGMYSVEYGPR